MKRKTKFRELDKFTQAYVTAALLSTNDESDESGGVPLDRNYDWDDISAESQARIIHDCKLFQAANHQLWADKPVTYFAADSYGSTSATADERAGGDFWYTRNGHGVGFWDSGRWPSEIGEKLTEASKRYGEVNINVMAGTLHFNGRIEYLPPGYRVREKLMWWHEKGLTQTATGYGHKLNSGYQLKLAAGLPNPWRRVYAICFSNAASYYILLEGRRVYLRSNEFSEAIATGVVSRRQTKEG